IELDAERSAEAVRNISEAGYSDDMEIRCADAADVLEELVRKEGQEEAERFDMVFLDGPKGQYLQYLPYIEKLVREGGVLIADNLLKEGEILRSRYAVTRRNRTIHQRMREFITQMTHSKRWQTLLIGDGDGMMAAVRKPDPEENTDTDRTV
ncbi:MAG: class I SAM-dependent methyltransferase, partial [Lachnospiraceae bacterium]|nr:class I SAM-dependent methyltransferase [Lachnospiraceae bacterium]